MQALTGAAASQAQKKKITLRTFKSLFPFLSH
jgi:hypothetical protein